MNPHNKVDLKKEIQKSKGRILLFQFFEELKGRPNCTIFESYLQDEVQTAIDIITYCDPKDFHKVSECQNQTKIYNKLLNMLSNCTQFLKDEKKVLANLEQICYNRNEKVEKDSWDRIVPRENMPEGY